MESQEGAKLPTGLAKAGKVIMRTQLLPESGDLNLPQARVSKLLVKLSEAAGGKDSQLHLTLCFKKRCSIQKSLRKDRLYIKELISIEMI
jgi:hypothetical protein